MSANDYCIFIRGPEKILYKISGVYCNRIIFKDIKSLYDFLVEIDTRKFFIDYCITVDEKFTGNGHHFKRGFTIHEKNKNVEQKFIYVETKFPVQNKITLRLCLAIVSGKNFYYCSQIDGDCPKKYFTIIFSHGLCIRCEIGIFPEGEIGDSILHNLPIRCSFLNVKEIVMNNLSGE